MKEGDRAPPLVVVGMEGIWGLMLTSFIVYPVAGLAQVVVLVYLLVILGYNVFAVSVTYLLNSIWHAILDNFRPVTVWGADLMLFYFFTQGEFGERWTIWSWLQLAGVLTLLMGTAVYNASMRRRVPESARVWYSGHELTPHTVLVIGILVRRAISAAFVALRVIIGEYENAVSASGVRIGINASTSGSKYTASSHFIVAMTCNDWLIILYFAVCKPMLGALSAGALFLSEVQPAMSLVSGGDAPLRLICQFDF
ncbi:hypothetical protein PHYPSEUDO_001037 [Phytophthora pseudosyringae]|uniref:Uncharacterized protein n=1 Tax=Phytophthora pseudosyringae TaxID=221518 RepID=A0A8T1VWF5_9STRA|nr:hypothetical protein PHYPSEUDO_001037 [Phytophthora pseudosyringae]